MTVDVKKEYLVALKGSGWSKIVTARNIAEAKMTALQLLKQQYPTKAQEVKPDRDLVAKLYKVYKDEKLVGQWKKTKNEFVGRRG